RGRGWCSTRTASPTRADPPTSSSKSRASSGRSASSGAGTRRPSARACSRRSCGTAMDRCSTMRPSWWPSSSERRAGRAGSRIRTEGRNGSPAGSVVTHGEVRRMDALRKRRLARCYARALLDVATAEGIDADLLKQELAAFAGAVQGDPVVGRIPSSPRLSRHQERAIIEAVASRIGVSRVVARLLRVLADRRRLTLLPDVLACYRERLWERRRIARARVTTAVPLDERQRRAVAERLTAATGRTVH